MYNHCIGILDGENIMFNGDEIFGTRNPNGSWDLEITGTESDSSGNSWERKLIIKGANIEIELSMYEPANVNITMTDSSHIESREIQFPLT
jgi:hypothetical protein